MKIKTTKITLPNKDYDEKLSKLERHVDYQRLDILDEAASNIFKINVPVLFRGESVKLNLPCTIHIKKKLCTIEVTVYGNITKPLVFTLAAAFLILFVSFIVYASIDLSIFMFLFGRILIGSTFLNQIRKQTRERVRKWF
ncbi:MAG: hypothetical protein COA32_16625 [Fluviicola sp.]|nr:MAG: hypothetical protein COA32_16625 [Fluviicola sp.]